MKIQLSGNEVMSTGLVTAGTRVTITAANADECFALVAVHKAVLLDENAVAATPYNVGPAYASYLARQGEISLSTGAPAVGVGAGSVFARIRTNLPGAIALINDGGGRVSLSGRTLLYTATSFVAATPVDIIVQVGNVQRTFTLYPVAAVSLQVQPYLGLVGSEGRINNALASTTIKQNNFRAHFTVAEARSSLGIVMPNWYWDPTTKTELGSGGTLTGEYFVEYPAGNFQRLTVGGANTGTAADGAEIQTDEVTLNTPIPAGADAWIRGYEVASNAIVFDNPAPNAGTTVRNGTFAQSKGEEFEYGASLTNKAGGGTITSTGGTSSSPMRRPAAIIGTTTLPSVLAGPGDSIAWGAFTTFLDNGFKGLIVPSLGSKFGVTNIGSTGDTTTGFIASHAKRVGLGRFASHLVSEFGINSVRGGSGESKTGAQLWADMQTIFGYFPGKKYIQTTLTPNDGSANAAQINAFNDIIRGKPAPLTAYYEVSDVLSTARNSNTYLAGQSGDSLHPNDTGLATVRSSGVINPAAITL